MSKDQPGRRQQARAIETRNALLETAIREFSRRGFDGVSLRQIEERAGTNRGLAGYHFGDKESLWHAAVNRLFDDLQQQFSERLPSLTDSDPGGAAREIARVFVRYSAQHPELNRLMMQESMYASWRMTALVDQHIQPLITLLRDALPQASKRLWGDKDPHRYYLLIGAGAYVFTAEQECRALFGQSPQAPDFIDRHVDLVLDMLIS